MGAQTNKKDNSDQKTDNRKQEVPGLRPAPEAKSWIGLVAVMIVVVPIAIRTPAVAVFIPPAMAMFPTPGTRFGKLMAILRGLRAIPTMTLGGFMEPVIRPGDAPLAIVVCAQRSGANEKEGSS